MTKELLLARRAALETDLDQQVALQQAAEADRQAAIERITNARDMINALSGAKQDVDFWLAKFAAEQKPEVALESQLTAEELNAKESLN